MKLTPDASMATRTSPTPGTGAGSSVNSRTSGPPFCLICIACMNKLYRSQGMRSASSPHLIAGTGRGQDHALPQRRIASRADDPGRDKTGIEHRAGECLLTVEANVAALVQRIGMPVPAVPQREGQVLEVAVIGRAAQEQAAGLERRKAALEEAPGVVEMLDHLDAVHQVKGPLAEV